MNEKDILTWLSKDFVLNNPLPSNCRMRYGLHWQNVCVQKLVNQQSYQQKISYKSGSSDTDTQTLSAELGVSTDNISAKISATIGHSVTITQETQVEETRSFSCDEGKTAIWIIWQLVEVYTVVDSQGNPVTYTGTMFNHSLNGMIRIPLSLPLNRLTNRIQMTVADRTDFIN